MKHLSGPKTASLVLFFLLLAQTIQAQGLENALGAFWTIVVLALGFGLLWLICLIVFLVNRGKKSALVSSILGLLMLVAGIWLSGSFSRYDDGFSSIGNSIEIAGIVNLLLVFVFMVVVPKKSAVQLAEELKVNDEQPIAQHDDRILKWLPVALGCWCFYGLYSSINFLRTVLTWRDSIVVSGGELFMVVMEFAMVALLVAALVLFVQRKRPGWNLLVFYLLYTVASYLVGMLWNIFFLATKNLHVPVNFFIVQLLLMGFLGACAWLLIRPGVRGIFALDDKWFRANMIVIIGAVVGLLALSNIIPRMLS